jgi:hypothetical protein
MGAVFHNHSGTVQALSTRPAANPEVMLALKLDVSLCFSTMLYEAHNSVINVLADGALWRVPSPDKTSGIAFGENIIQKELQIKTKRNAELLMVCMRLVCFDCHRHFPHRWTTRPWSTG